MLKRSFVAVAVVTVSLLATAQAQAQQAPARPRPAAHLPGVRVMNLHRAYEARLGHIRPGRVAGFYARGEQPGAPKGRPAKLKNHAATCSEPACPVVYQGGPVQHTPHVYLLLWGPDWSSVTGEEATRQYLTNFFAGLGNQQPGTGSQQGDIWSGITSQYGDTTGHPTFTGSVFMGAFQDLNQPPTGTTQLQIAAEADAFASSHGITDLADAQIVVATQSGTCQQGFADPSCPGAGPFCAFAGNSGEPYINLPYLLDAGAACGEDFVNNGGTYDGFSLIGGALYADTITNPEGFSTPPSPAWIDTADTVSGGGVADKCAFGHSFSANDPVADMDLLVSPGVLQPFAMQSLWSNAAGGCVMSAVAKDTLTVTSPGSMSNTVGDAVSRQLVAISSGSYLITWRASGLPAGLSLGSSTGLITGTPNTAGTFSVNVTATDETGASRSASFNWAINPAGGRIKAANGKCLDDSGAGTANGNKIDIWTCNGTKAQVWTFSASGAVSVLGKCLDDLSQSGAGTKLVLFACTGHKAQTWSHKSNGEYVLKLNGLCLTDPSGSTANGTQVQIRACKNFKDQHWSLP